AREAGQVVRRREEAGVSGDAAEAMTARVVDLADQPGLAALLRGSDPLPQSRAGKEGGVLHAERREQVLLGEAVEGRTADASDDLPQDDVTHVAVDESLAGGRERFEEADVRWGLAPAIGVV